MAEPTCDDCGEPARVHITDDAGPEPTMRHLCFACADREEAASTRRERGLDRAAIVLTVGLLVLVLSAGADVFRFGRSEGFGASQITGMALAGFLIIMGALTRVSTMLVIGVLAGGLTLLADWLGLGRSEGFGIQQWSGSAVGLLLILAGWRMSLRRR